MAKHKVAELKGPLLNLAVAVALEIPVFYMDSPEWSNSAVNAAMRTQKVVVKDLAGRLLIQSYDHGSEEWSPSTDWAQGGPLIPKHRISLDRVKTGAYAAISPEPADWTGGWIYATVEDGPLHQLPLIAAMRCLVASRFGEWVELPEVEGWNG